MEGDDRADDAGMRANRDRSDSEPSLSDLAREEFGLTARAFFAPVIGAVQVMRFLFSGAVASGAGAPPPRQHPERERDAA